jgi:hypothetical protein
VAKKKSEDVIVPAKPAINICSYILPMTLPHGPHFPQENGGSCTISYPGKTHVAPRKKIQLY